MTVKTLTVSGLNVAAQVLGGTGLTSSTTNGVTTLSVSGTQASGTIFLNPTATSYSELYVDSNDRRVTLGQRSSTNTGGDLAYLYTATATPMSFWTSATERLRITAAGNVGIGTSTPAQLLHVAGRTLIGGATTNALWDINADSMGINRNISTGAIYDTTGHGYQWQHTKSTTAASNKLTLEVYTPAGVGVAGGMTITGAGNVGIGNSTPAEKLHINGNVLLENNNGFYVKNNVGTSCRIGAVDTVNQLLFGDGLTTSMYFTAGQNIYFSANGLYRGNINGTNGYWRIGDSNAASVPMDVFANVTQSANVLRLTAQSGYFTFANGTFSAVNTVAKTIVLTIDSAEATTAAQITAGAIGSAIYGTGAGFGSFTVFSSLFTVTSATTTSNKLVITCTWTGAPAATPSNGQVTSIIINGFRAGWGPQLLFAGMGDGRDTGAIRVLTETENSGANAYMAFCTRGLETVPERMRLTSTGALGIGTTDPKATLHTNGTFALTTATSGTANSVILAAANYALPDAATCSGRMYWVKNTSASAITMTSAGGTIDGVAAATGVSLSQYDCYTVISNGTNWFVI